MLKNANPFAWASAPLPTWVIDGHDAHCVADAFEEERWREDDSCQSLAQHAEAMTQKLVALEVHNPVVHAVMFGVRCACKRALRALSPFQQRLVQMRLREVGPPRGWTVPFESASLELPSVGARWTGFGILACVCFSAAAVGGLGYLLFAMI